LRNRALVRGLVLLASISIGCPAMTKVVLRNESSNAIDVLSAYSDAVLGRIPPNMSEVIVYNQDCFRVRSAGRVLGFYPVVPPDQYIEVDTFSTRIFAIFTESQGLEITAIRGEQSDSPNISLELGCLVKE